MADLVNPPLLVTRKAALDAATARVRDAANELAEARQARARARSDLIDAIDQVQAVDGLTWKQIGAQLGTTAQAASQMYRRFAGRT